MVEVPKLPLQCTSNNSDGSQQQRIHQKHQTKRLRRFLAFVIPPCLLLSTILNSPTKPFSSKLRKLVGSSTSDCNDGPGPYISVDQASSNMPNLGSHIHRIEPSHVSLCRELIQRHATVLNGVSPVTTYMKTEDSNICTDWSAPHYSLMEIMASSVLGTVGESYGMSYMHNCRKTHPSAADLGGSPHPGLAFDVTTIQQIFPESGLVMEDDNIPIQDVVQLCKGCLSEFDSMTHSAQDSMSLSHVTHQCLLFPGSANADGRSSSADTIFPLRDILPTVRDRLQFSAAEYYKQSHPPKDEHISGVVIYIDEMSVAMPFYIYGKYIPPFVTSITILGTPKCATTRLPTGELCVDHGRALREFFSTFYPSIETRFDIAASTAAAYSRTILSKSLICPPGTVTCLLPALAKAGDSHAIIVESPARYGTYHWFESFGNELSDNIVLIDIDYELLSDRNAEVVSILMTNPDKREDGCDNIRGKMGYWAADDAYGMQAMTRAKMRGTDREGIHVGRDSRPLLGIEEEAGGRSVDKGDSSYEPLAYKWVETAFPTCQLDTLTLGGLCHIVEMLDIKRIFFVGDALQAQMVLSFWALLDLEDYPGHKTMGLWNRVVDCPYPYNKGESFEISFVRNDNLNGNNDAEVTQETVNFPWVQNYASYGGRTLLVASTGAHQHHVNTYRASVDNFVMMMDEIDRKDDIVVYRTAAPGHRDCSESTAGRTDTVGTDKFTDYNHYMLGKLQNRDRVMRSALTGVSSSPSVTSMSQLSASVEIRSMDVYPMTMLHPHGKEGLSSSNKKLLHDCQHDYLPGPPDGWNHMLYTTLVDLVNEKRTGERHPLW